MDAVLDCENLNQCSVLPSVESVAFPTKKKDEKLPLGQEPKTYWEVSGHCDKLLFPISYPDIQLSTRSANFNYLRYRNEAVPDQELVRQVRVAYYQVLTRLNQSDLQVKNFILPVQLLNMKHIDPYSRQRIVEGICKFLSSQTQLRSVVLEQAGVSFADFCRFLLSIARNSLVKRLYFWDVVDKCGAPFKGPLQSYVNLDDLPRIPYTYNPGGRKYLRQIAKSKNVKEVSLKGQRLDTEELNSLKKSKASLNAWIEGLIEECLKVLSENEPMSLENISKIIDQFFENIDQRDFVFTQMDVGIQCEIFHESTETICHFPRRTSKPLNISNASLVDDLLTKAKIDCCRQFLKVYENSEIRILTLRNIYKIALSGLIYLTKLSINYGLLADGTGETLMSIGSVAKGKLKELQLLCEMVHLPSQNSRKYDQDALQSIPDQTWNRLKKYCPDLKVGMVLSYMSTNEVTKMFITKSIPLNSVHFDNGFCPTLDQPQIMFFKTLKMLSLCFSGTLEQIGMVFWHSSGKLDGALESFILNTSRLRSFEFHGPIVHRATVGKLCDAALRPSSELVSFKLMVQGDPCYPEIARQLTKELYQFYLPKFCKRSIQLTLGTHNS